jgi:predicted nucleic acid-binding protein
VLSALATRGLCAELTALVLRHQTDGELEFLVSPAVRTEVLRVLRDKFRAGNADLAAADAAMALALEVEPAPWQPPPGFPDANDVAIVAAALGARADRFVTGDRALLALDAIQNMRLVDPRAAYVELRGLG